MKYIYITKYLYYAPFLFFDETALVVRGTVRQHLVAEEDVFVVDQDVADEIDDVRVVLDWVTVWRSPEQSRAETDRQVVRIHHVLVAEFRHAAQHQSASLKMAQFFIVNHGQGRQ